ncbi:MSMEG_0570 family nitrogen starvation response protein [filamentous cyanobacterium CCP5]|nr:MSMEG_0570 family nitrogen starvation response protein [filamentous cyanobacterium CCP5]
MPEIRFQVRWPDGTEETCYSPSLVVQDYFEAGANYALDEFLNRSRTALTIASDRVQAKYGFPCGRALGQLQLIEQRSAEYASLDTPQVHVLKFIP